MSFVVASSDEARHEALRVLPGSAPADWPTSGAWYVTASPPTEGALHVIVVPDDVVAYWRSVFSDAKDSIAMRNVDAWAATLIALSQPSHQPPPPPQPNKPRKKIDNTSLGYVASLLQREPTGKYILSEAFIAQKRTSQYKAHVYLLPDQQTVYKGPYPWPKKAPMLAALLFRYDLFKNIWNDRVNGPFDLVRFDDLPGAVYVRMPHIHSSARPWVSKRERVIGEARERLVVDKPSQGFEELSTYLSGASPQDGALVAGVLHFVHRYACDPIVGDAALRNVLVITDTVVHESVGIDYDENRTGTEVQRQKERNEGFFAMLSGGKKWKRAHQETLTEALRRNQTAVRAHLHEMVTSMPRVRGLIAAHRLSDTVSAKRIRQRIDALRNAFDQLVPSADDSDEESSSTSDGISDSSESSSDSDSSESSSDSDSSESSSDSDSSSSTSDDDDGPTLGDLGSQTRCEEVRTIKGEMVYSFRHAVSQNGHTKDELLSALQKYIRRGELDKALYVGVELEKFHALMRAKALVTNAVNRLRVALPEETAGIASPRLSVLFNRYYHQFEENRKVGGREIDRQRAFVSMVTLLVRAPKQRLISDIKAVYFTPGAKQFAMQRDDLRSLYPDEYTLDEQVVAARYPLKRGDDESALRPIVDGLLTAFKRKSDHGFYWLNRLAELTESGKVVAKRKVGTALTAQPHPMYLAFELYYAYATRGASLWDRSALKRAPSAELRATLDVCFEYYTHFGLKRKTAKGGGQKASHRDWVVFVIWPALYCVRRIDWNRNAPEDPDYTDDEVRRIYARNDDDPPMILDDYCYDLHTRRGRSMGRGPEFFAAVGAITTNQDETLFNERYRRLYNEYKKVQQRQRAKKRK